MESEFMEKGTYIELKPQGVKDEVWIAVVKAWADGLSDREACFRASKEMTVMLKPDTVRQWKKDNPEIGELCEFLKDDLKAAAKQNVARTLRSGDKDGKMSRWYLEHKCPDEFSTKSAVAFEGAVVELTLEEKEKALQALMETFNNGE